MSLLRTAVKLAFALLAILLGLVWTGLMPRPALLPPALEIEPLTYLLSAVAAAMFIFWKNNDVKSEAVADSHRLTEADESINAEITKYLKSRYEHRIRQKLAGREPVNLRKTPSFTGTSDESAQNFITLPAEKVPSGMAELFDEARGRLLVVGAPGAGKTTLLLQLALALLERPSKDLPVLLNLATWRSEFADFDEWLQRILPLELGASKALAEKIRRNIPLILLLDGLDEVPEDARASCLQAIGRLGADAKQRFVISSRKNELKPIKKLIPSNIYLSVEVAPLTPKQVEEFLTAWVYIQPEAKTLLNAIKEDQLLFEAMQSPFHFNTAQILFARGKTLSDFNFKANNIDGRRQEIVTQFIEEALQHKVAHHYPMEVSRKWLSFLAAKMRAMENFDQQVNDIKKPKNEKRKIQGNAKTEFELSDVKPTWANFTIYRSIISLLTFTVFFMLFALFSKTHQTFIPIGTTFIPFLNIWIFTTIYALTISIVLIGIFGGTFHYLSLPVGIGLLFGAVKFFTISQDNLLFDSYGRDKKKLWDTFKSVFVKNVKRSIKIGLSVGLAISLLIWIFGLLQGKFINTNFISGSLSGIFIGLMLGFFDGIANGLVIAHSLQEYRVYQPGPYSRFYRSL